MAAIADPTVRRSTFVRFARLGAVLAGLLAGGSIPGPLHPGVPVACPCEEGGSDTEPKTESLSVRASARPHVILAAWPSDCGRACPGRPFSLWSPTSGPVGRGPHGPHPRC